MPAAMSAVGGRADVICQGLSGPFLANRRHSKGPSGTFIVPGATPQAWRGWLGRELPSLQIPAGSAETFAPPTN